MTLLIMAAGLGSRYGGLKQLEGFGTHNHLLLEYSIYDAIIAGFDRVVFIIKKENLTDFKTRVGDKLSSVVKVEYVFQTNDLPEGYSAPDRQKPLGTGHAILCAMSAIGSDDFAVINADDFYSRQAFITIAEHLKRGSTHCLAGYRLANTVSKHGTVSRGVCTTDSNSLLTGIMEHEKIDAHFTNHSTPPVTLTADTIVSMNAWGFKATVFPFFQSEYLNFLEQNKSDLSTCEFYLTYPISKLAQTENISVISTNASWFGVTYKEDKEPVNNAINDMVRQGIYPERLWTK